MGFPTRRVRGHDVLRVVAELGSSYVVAFALVVTGLIAYRQRGQTPVIGFLVTVGAGQAMLSNTIKLIVGRERPAVLPLVESHSSSFPSGHSTAAAACWAAIALVLSRKRPRLVRFLCAGMAC